MPGRRRAGGCLRGRRRVIGTVIIKPEGRKMIPRSDRMAKVHSDIRGPLYEEALRMQQRGEKVLKLNR